MTVYYTEADSPLGLLRLASDGTALTGLFMTNPMAGHRALPDTGLEWVCEDAATPFSEAKRQLAAYFAGELTLFDLPLAPKGTDFQKQVWAALSGIDYGATVSYGALARQIGSPNASRAVGVANGRNPLSIIVPCHRVVGASGALTGYSGGLSRKEALLDLERKFRTKILAVIVL